MGFNVITQNIGVRKSVFEGSAEQSVNIDITLHDYYPDIQRVLKCTIEPGITSVQTSAGRVTADGTATIRVVYVGEDGTVRSFEQSSALSKSVETQNLPDNASVCVRAHTDYVNCRTVSQRRVNVSGMITLYFSARTIQEEAVVTGAGGGGVQLKVHNVAAASIVGDAEKSFAMGEVVELGQGKPPVMQIIRSSAVATLDEVKTISNKILIKGELKVGVLYCADNDACEIVLFGHTMPISQIIDVPGVTEDSTSDIKLSVMSFEVSPKSDSSGELRLLDMNARISASISSYSNTEIPVIADAYSVFHDLKTEYKQTQLQGISDVFKDSFLSRGSFDIAGGAVSVIDMWCAEPAVSSAVCNDGLLRISGSTQANILYTDREGKTDYAEKMLDFEYERQIKAATQSVKCEPHLAVTDCSAVTGGDGKIEARIEYNIEALAFSQQQQRIAGSFSLDESSEKVGNGAALTIYFANEGEDVWSIAKQYNTTVDAVMQENSLSDDVLREDMMLMIPKP